MSKVLSVAYGSNLHPTRIQARVPSAKFLGVVSLPGYSLAFHKRSKDGSGKALLYKGDCAFGAVYEMLAEEKHLLDEAEGLGMGYYDRGIEVNLNGSNTKAFVYMASAEVVDHKLKPYHWYKSLVLAGAIYHGLPTAYIASIEAVASVQDLKKERREKNELLLRGMTVLPKGLSCQA